MARDLDRMSPPARDAGRLDAVSQARPLVDRMRADLPAGARILALGPESVAVSNPLAEAGFDVMAGTEEDLPAVPDSATFDAAIAFDLVEHSRWDRWLLQRIHAAVRDGGLVLLALPNLYAWRSLASPSYVLSKLAKRFGVAARTGHGARGHDAARRYARADLAATLERLGFDIVGWTGASAAGAPPGADWIPPAGRSRHIVLAVRRPAVFGEGRPFPDPMPHCMRYEREHQAYVRVRDAWTHRHGLSGSAATPIDPAAHAGRNVLVLAPHPDDELIGCGGTMLRLARAGASVTVLHATDGAASAALEGLAEAERRSVRTREADDVARRLGFQTVHWREDNRAFAVTSELVSRLRSDLDRLDPELVFCPFPTDDHPDHRTLNRILAAALEGVAPGLTVVAYEVWGCVPPNRYCDVSAEARDIEAALYLYSTAMKVDDFVHLRADRGYYHAWRLTGAQGYLEAFFAAGPAAYRTVVNDLIR